MPVITVGQTQIFDLPHTLVDGTVIIDPRFQPLKAAKGSLAVRSEVLQSDGETFTGNPSGWGEFTYYKWGDGDTDWIDIRYPQKDQDHFRYKVSVPASAHPGNPFRVLDIDLAQSSNAVGGANQADFRIMLLKLEIMGLQTNPGGDSGDTDDGFYIAKTQAFVYYPDVGGGPTLNLDTNQDTGAQDNMRLFTGGDSNDREMDYETVVTGNTTLGVDGWNGEDTGGGSGRDMDWWIRYRVSVPELDK
jgi:hypothetical protein